ncbi:2-desacetyl-2-hydroxyethyl bacteriochlorophyllide A dehydrogenase [Primorskyibacter sedentarius]|uniref:2-desacetyl-2-hydroxyethyl bacteriochlorophyllide A dehydrogenase n=1 Tax=Primorskyibacter sedentarius TaxID=745311 RepID=A0A4R3J9A2_9RHOB|nr:zinc-binding alcohol dehydrogenase family protein [Primorskyibacter sedentarius]TCS61556.1 2-desacetyl-2-hydroxyethyl bacteriochlorophyllide A dehydrogenase [Primorskyibacter sedentarius]
MQALVITNIGQTEIREVEAPSPGRDEVLLSVQHVGLCGSDLNTYSGLNPLVQLPRIPGHEIGGEILERGANVPETFQVGATAIVIPYTTCGECSACLAGRQNACRYNRTLGVQQDGGMSNLLVVRHDRLILNNTLTSPHRALVEPLSVGFHAVARGRVTADDTVVVLGGGMIGVGAMLGALARGARVLAVEVSESKRQTLLDLGVSEVLNPTRCNLADEVMRLTGDHGTNVVIEAVGLPETFRSAIDLVCFAGRVVYVGYAKQDVSYNTSLFNLKELDIMGSRNATRADFNEVIAFLEANPTIGDRLISRIFPWAEAQGSFEYWQDHRNETFKVMISLEGQ